MPHKGGRKTPHDNSPPATGIDIGAYFAWMNTQLKNMQDFQAAAGDHVQTILEQQRRISKLENEVFDLRQANERLVFEDAERRRNTFL